MTVVSWVLQQADCWDGKKVVKTAVGLEKLMVVCSAKKSAGYLVSWSEENLASERVVW